MHFEAPQDASGSWKGYSWSRELYLNRRKMFEYGPNCETCGFYMRQAGHLDSSVTIETVRENLNSHMVSLSDDIVEPLSTLLPSGTWGVSLREIKPVFIPDPEFYSPMDTAPCRLSRKEITGRVNESKVDKEGYIYSRILFEEHVLPVQKTSSLNEERIRYYEARMSRGETPCAVSYSFIELHGRGSYDIYFNHILLDGHHKLHAAARGGFPVKLLSFIDCRESEYGNLIFLHNHWKSPATLEHIKNSIRYVYEKILDERSD